MGSRLEEPRGVEQREKCGFAPEESVGDELPAAEAEDVAVTGVTGGDPDLPVVSGYQADEWQRVLGQSKDSGPAVRYIDLAPDKLMEEALERRLDRQREFFDVRELVEDREVTEPAEHDAAVGKLLPVVEAVARVVRAVVQRLRERLAHYHLAARRPDQVGELGDEAVPVPVGRDEDAVSVERADVLDRFVLAELDARLRGERRKPSNEPRRLDRAVLRVRDRTVELPRRRTRNVVEPLGLDAVLAQRLVLEPDRVALLLVGSQAVAASTAERISREFGEAGELFLGPQPVRLRLLGAVRLARDVVAGRTAAESEAAVTPARALRDPAGIVDPNAQAALCEPECCRAAGDAGADDRDVDPAVVPAGGEERCGIFKPVRVQDVGR
jgi:hypothetical protein